VLAGQGGLHFSRRLKRIKSALGREHQRVGKRKAGGWNGESQTETRQLILSAHCLLVVSISLLICAFRIEVDGF